MARTKAGAAHFNQDMRPHPRNMAGSESMADVSGGMANSDVWPTPIPDVLKELFPVLTSDLYFKNLWSYWYPLLLPIWILISELLRFLIFDNPLLVPFYIVMDLFVVRIFHKVVLLVLSLIHKFLLQELISTVIKAWFHAADLLMTGAVNVFYRIYLALENRSMWPNVSGTFSKIGEQIIGMAVSLVQLNKDGFGYVLGLLRSILTPDAFVRVLQIFMLGEAIVFIILGYIRNYCGFLEQLIEAMLDAWSLISEEYMRPVAGSSNPNGNPSTSGEGRGSNVQFEASMGAANRQAGRTPTDNKNRSDLLSFR